MGMSGSFLVGLQRGDDYLDADAAVHLFSYTSSPAVLPGLAISARLAVVEIRELKWAISMLNLLPGNSTTR